MIWVNAGVMTGMTVEADFVPQFRMILATMMETSARLLRLLSLLQARRGWSGPQLADRLGVTTRTVRRDVDRLRRRSRGSCDRVRPAVRPRCSLGVRAASPVTGTLAIAELDFASAAQDSHGNIVGVSTPLRSARTRPQAVRVPECCSRIAAVQAVSAATEQVVGVLPRTFTRVRIGEHPFRLVVFSALDERVGEMGRVRTRYSVPARQPV